MDAIKKHCLCRQFPGATWAINPDGSIAWDAAANGRELPEESEYYTQDNIDSYVPPIAVYEWTPGEFLALFTPQEQAAFVQAAKANAALAVMQLQLTTAESIRSDSERVVSGMAGLASAGVLTQSRASEILGVA